MRRLAGFLFAALALATQLGCLWPFPTGSLLAGRGRITRDYAAPLQVGVTTREDALLHLGEPDVVLEGGRVFIYRWTEVRGFFLLAGYGGGGGVAIPFPGHRALRLEFGPGGQLISQAFGRAEVPNSDPESAPQGSDRH